MRLFPQPGRRTEHLPQRQITSVCIRCCPSDTKLSIAHGTKPSIIRRCPWHVFATVLFVEEGQSDFLGDSLEVSEIQKNYTQSNSNPPHTSSNASGFSRVCRLRGRLRRSAIFRYRIHAARAKRVQNRSHTPRKLNVPPTKYGYQCRMSIGSWIMLVLETADIMIANASDKCTLLVILLRNSASKISCQTRRT